MKQSAAKTLGVAALGAAFAAASAGSAAALTSVPNHEALGTVTKAVPIEQTAALPGGAGEALALTQGAVEAVGSAGPDVPVGTPIEPVAGLLGGLPTGGSLGAVGLG